jgi:hypothetical protein
MTTRIKLRRDTQANWTDVNPVLALGEAGYDTTNHQIRVGDGTTAWMDLHPIGGSGNVASPDGNSILWLDNGAQLRAGTVGFDNILIGPSNHNAHAQILVSQDDPYIRSEVTSTTSQNYKNDMLWHASYFSRYTKFTADAYGAHIKNAQWSGPGTEYNNQWSFTRDGILDMPPAAEIRVNPAPYGGINYSRPFPAADQNLTITANVVNISGGRLDMGGSQQGGFISVLGPVQQGITYDQYWYEAVATDTNGNVYVAGGSYDTNHYTIITKFDPTGQQLWSQYLRDSNNSNAPFTGEPNSIDHDGTNLIVTANYYGDPNSVLVVYLNPLTGAVTSSSCISDAQNFVVDARDVAMAYSFGNHPLVAGIRTGGTEFISPDVSGITQTVANRLVVHADTFAGNLTPDPRFSAWNMYGPGITGNVIITQVNNFTTRSATRTSGSGTGTNATFTVDYTPGGAYTVQVTYNGSGYDSSDVLKIAGTALGGTTPANDLTFHITTDGGTITGVTTVTGTATNNYALGLYGDPVDFTTLMTPTITMYQTTSGFMELNGTTTIVGNVGFTQINSVAQEYNTTDGNVYVGGTSQPGYGQNQHAFITKFNYDGTEPLWTVQVDDAYHYGVVTGLVSDSDKAVISVGDNTEGQIIVTKVDTNGQMVWQRSIDVATNLDGTNGIALGDDNSVLVTAAVATLTQVTHYHLMITKLTKDGDLAWSRTLGAARDAGSVWEFNHRDIIADEQHFYVNGWAKGLGLNQSGSTNGFLAKLPLDGTGTGRYGDWIYTQFSLDMTEVTNTSANVLAIPFRTVISGPEAFLTPSLANINTNNEGSSHQTYKLGGPGNVVGVGNVQFTNGATIGVVEEEGLMLWQPGVTQQQDDSDNGPYAAEYIAVGYGGRDAVNANVQISAGTYGWGHDEGPLTHANYNTGHGPRQVNIDVIGKYPGSEGHSNISNWHFDEDGSMYLPDQGYYVYTNATLSGNSAIYGGNVVQMWFDKTAYPGLTGAVQVGDKVWHSDQSQWTPVLDTGDHNDTQYYINVLGAWFTTNGNPDVVTISGSRNNGIVYPDNSKHTAAGRKIIPGFSGNEGFLQTYAYVQGTTERMIWIASSTNISAFRGTFRCQLTDPSTAMKIYDVTGANYRGAGGNTSVASTTLLDINSGGVTDPVTFRAEIGVDNFMRLYATGPAGFSGTVYITWDITEFNYTAD